MATVFVGQQRRDKRKDGDAATRSIFSFRTGGNFEASFKAVTEIAQRFVRFRLHLLTCDESAP